MTRSQYQAVIVPANRMDRQGNLNDETRARVDQAARALQGGVAPLMVTCGWAYRHDSDICIAHAMKSYAVQNLEVAATAVLEEPASRDTVGDAVFTKRNFATPLGWSRVLIVTSSYHLARAIAIFSFVYGPAALVDGVGVASAESDEIRLSEARSLSAFRRTFEGIDPGDDAAIYARLRTRHPFYNGEVHPHIGA
ncbi:MAG: YdcF family protein [Steroidobacteraceae bacterium]